MQALRVSKQLVTASLRLPSVRVLPGATTLHQPSLFGLRSLSVANPSLPRRFSKVAAMAVEAAAPAVEAPKEIFRKDYTPTPYLVEKVHMDFNLNDETRVITKSAYVPNYSGDTPPEIVLNGRADIKLESVSIDGKAIAEGDYELTPKLLTIKSPPQGAFELQIVTLVEPKKNTELEGLYNTGGNYCTQCEAEGFRGITYFYDRPDVMAKYTVRVEGNKRECPVLLSNGNLVESGEAGEGRHYTVWEDPWPKPCYLFALVAGALSMAEDEFVTMSGKTVALRIYVQEQNLHKVSYAMQSLQRAMKWDEERYGLEYDLELFNIVAVDDFNMGAMENKSLNVFNSRLVLASAETATDGDFQAIEAVVGHEYFHNFTGNRVTCRDWFQLTLKEGLTVYRDSEFTSDLNSRSVKRIEDAMVMRTSQYAEDAGPMAHPVRPDSYIKMDNFYTVTVYEKGCEVVRMYETILGREGFRKGMDLYFQRHDGQAVTCDDFLAAMADANDEDLSGLQRWYSQARTPTLTVSTSYDSAAQTYTITTKQSVEGTKTRPETTPVLIPLAVGLLAKDGSDMPFEVSSGRHKMRGTTAVLLPEAESDTFVLSGVTSAPTPSLLRNFSAPVKMVVEGQSDEDLVFILANDTDAYNRWDASQRLTRKLLLKLYDAASSAGEGAALEDTLAGAGGVSDAIVEAFRAILTDSSIDGATAAMTITLPSQSELIQTIEEADPQLVHAVRTYVVRTLARRLVPELTAVAEANTIPASTPYSPDAASASKRMYKNKALALLVATGDAQYPPQMLKRFRESTNMTDSITSIATVIDADCEERGVMLEEFYARWKDEPLVVLKWLGLQAGSNKAGNLTELKALVEHPAFVITNPNSCYSLVGGFGRSPENFHAADGSGYEFLADMVIKIDSINKQVASRMVGAFTSYKQLDKKRQALMQEQLRRILKTENLSENVFEIASKSVE